MLFWAMAVMCASGCQAQSRSSVKTFLFPEPETAAETKTDTEVAKPKTMPPQEKQTGDAAPEYLLVSHKPYIDRECVECHEGASAFSTPIFGDDWDGVFREGGGKPGPLLLPIKELCLKCHKDLRVEWSEKRGLVLHTTAKEGECVKCHVPHQGRHPFRLIVDRDQLCQRCHNADEKTGTPKCVRELQVTGPCLSCHNAHLGVDKSLLAKDYEEPDHTVPPQGEAPGEDASPVDGKT